MFRCTIKYRNLGCRLVKYKQESTVAATGSTLKDHALPFSEIPKIPTLPYIGSGWIYYPLIGKYKLQRMHKASVLKYQEYGPIHREKFSRDFEVVSIYDPEDIAKMYQSEGRFPDRKPVESFQKYRNDKKDLYNNGGLLTTLGQEWWEVRSQVQPHMMKPKSVHSYVGAMDQVSKEFTDRMVHLRGKDGGEVPDYLNELYKWAFESVSLVAFDVRLGCIDVNPNKEAVRMIKAVNTVFEQMMKLEMGSLSLWKRFHTPAYRKFEKSMDYFSREAYKYLEKAKRRLEEKTEDHEVTFLEKMISTTKDPRDINAMVTDMVFGGIDTTASTVGFTLYHLARHPEAQEKLYNEIKSTVKDLPLSKDVLSCLPYLKACVKEGMRLTPVVIGNLRTLSEETVMSGYVVPAGTQVLTNQYALSHMEKYFPEAEKFRPERFLRGEAEHDPFGFLPFGFGRRSCIGRRIAEQEIWTLLIRLIERFRVEYHHEDLDINVRGIGTPDKPLRFQFYDR